MPSLKPLTLDPWWCHEMRWEWIRFGELRWELRWVQMRRDGTWQDMSEEWAVKRLLLGYKRFIFETVAGASRGRHTLALLQAVIVASAWRRYPGTKISGRPDTVSSWLGNPRTE
jgi:hypothetical protein